MTLPTSDARFLFETQVSEVATSKRDTPWIIVRLPKSGEVTKATVSCEACGKESVIPVDDDVETSADRINREYERHRDCAEVVYGGDA